MGNNRNAAKISSTLTARLGNLPSTDVIRVLLLLDVPIRKTNRLNPVERAEIVTEARTATARLIGELQPTFEAIGAHQVDAGGQHRSAEWLSTCLCLAWPVLPTQSRCERFLKINPLPRCSAGRTGNRPVPCVYSFALVVHTSCGTAILFPFIRTREPAIWHLFPSPFQANADRQFISA